jgi:hypothetical protein
VPITSDTIGPATFGAVTSGPTGVNGTQLQVGDARFGSDPEVEILVEVRDHYPKVSSS